MAQSDVSTMGAPSTTTPAQPAKTRRPKSSNVLHAVNELAKEGKYALDLLSVFQGDKQLEYLYKDGTSSLVPTAGVPVSVTLSKIVEYVFPKRAGELPPTLGGFSFEDLLNFLYQLEGYLAKQTEYEFPDLHQRPRWTERQQKIRFGTNLELSTTFPEVDEAIRTAISLTEYIISYSDYSKEEVAAPKTGGAAPAPAQQPAEEDITFGGLAPGLSLGDDKKKKKEEEEKEKDKKEKPKTPQAIVQELTKGDAAFHKEVVRMEVMLANQLAEFYGKTLDPQALESFKQQLMPYIAPHLYFELQKLGAGELSEVLKSAKARSSIYLNALVRMQQDPSFHAQLGNVLQLAKDLDQKQAKPKTATEKAQQLAQQLAENAKAALGIPAKEIAAGILTKEEGQTFLSPEEIDAAKSVRSTSAATFADEIRTLFGEKGVGLAESDINNILVHLQTFAITRKNVHQLSDQQYKDIFGTVFGPQNTYIFDRIQQYFSTSQIEWARLFSGYTQSLRLDLFNENGNAALLFLDKNAQPTDKVLEYWHKVVFNNGVSTAADSLYVSKKELESKKASIEAAELASGQAPQNNPLYIQLTSALGLKANHAAALKNLAALNPSQQQAVFNELGYTFTQGKFAEEHIQETLQYLQQYFMGGEGGAVGVGGVLSGLAGAAGVGAGGAGAGEGGAGETQFIFDFIMPPSFLTGEIIDGVFIPPQVSSQFGSFISQLGSAEGQPDHNELDHMIGLATLAIITGGASIPIVEKIEKVSTIVRLVPGGDKLLKHVWAPIDMLGKMIKWALSLGFISMLVHWLAMLLAAIKAFQFALSIGTFLKGLASKAAIGLKSLIVNAGSLLSKFAATIGHTLSGLGAGAIGALGGITSASAFSGTLIGATTAGFLGLGMVNVINLNGAFLTDVGGGTKTGKSYASGLQNQGCWPTSGRVTGLDTYGPPDDKPHGVTSQGIVGLSGNLVYGVGPNRKGQAVDIAAPQGSRVYAPYPGTAIFYRDGAGICYWSGSVKKCGYGNHVVLKSNIDGDDLVFIFGHLLDFGNFSEGESEVQVGDVIGTVDDTGNSTGNHLHYEVLGATRDSIIPEPIDFNQVVHSTCTSP